MTIITRGNQIYVHMLGALNPYKKIKVSTNNMDFQVVTLILLISSASLNIGNHLNHSKFIKCSSMLYKVMNVAKRWKLRGINTCSKKKETQQSTTARITVSTTRLAQRISTVLE